MPGISGKFIAVAILYACWLFVGIFLAFKVFPNKKKDRSRGVTSMQEADLIKLFRGEWKGDNKSRAKEREYFITTWAIGGAGALFFLLRA